MTRLEKLSGKNAEAMESLEKECFSKPWSKEILLAELENPLNDFFGAFEEEKLIGYIGMQTVAGESSIFNVAVEKEFRRRGIGRSLVEKLVEEAKAKGAETVFLEVRSGNLPAIYLYEKLDFVFCGLRKNYYSDPTENAFLMKLALKGEQEREDPIDCWDME